MKKYFHFHCFFFLLLIGSPLSQLLAQQSFHKCIPDLPSKPALVNDLADMLTDDEEAQLELKLFTFEQSSSNEISIVTVNELCDLDVNEFAVQLGRKWDIGKEKKKNGVLVLASKNDRKINISPAYGLSGALPDVICSRIIRTAIVPNFKTGNYFMGFDEATDHIIAATKGEFTADETQPSEGIPIVFILLLFMGMFILFFYLTRRSRKIYVSRRGYKYNDGGWGSFPGGGGFFGGSGWGGGGGDSGGGGFGGFGGGGGGFDGGGASGSW